METMNGSLSLPDDCFSASADHHNAYVADQYLNLGDDIQTQAGSLPSMDFTGSSVGPDSLSNVDETSPVLAGVPMHPQRSTNEVETPGFTYGPVTVNNGMYMVGPAAPLATQHAPDCPSHRPMAQHMHHPPMFPMNDQAQGHQTATHAWNVNGVSPVQGQNPQSYSSLSPGGYQQLTSQALLTGVEPSEGRQSTSSQGRIPTSRSLPVQQVQKIPNQGPYVTISSNQAAGAPAKPTLQTSGVPQLNGNAMRDPQGISPVSTPGSGITQDLDGGPGRRSHLYMALPRREDNLFHCAYEGQPECTHEPTKLKCNYDKYIDSHLKPYRCKQEGCEELRFSSTACRLRHEREAHGSHGHGVNPYLCLYEGCERSKQDKGFPRAWNRNDHMKRCHGHIPSENEESESSPTTTVKPEISITTHDISKESSKESRKRTGKQSDASPTVKRQRTQIKRPKQPASNDAQESAIEGLDRQQRLHDDWRRRRLQLQESVHNLQGPNDAAALQRIQTELNAMFNIHKELTG
ncbi:MAG: hypothetical protein Q9162_007613 [Coniocarpon cinnabarinum]